MIGHTKKTRLRIKNYENLENMQSPIKNIIKNIPLAPFNIAPEMKERFINEFPELTIEIIDSDEWIFKIAIEDKHIYLSRRVVEIFWAVSYSYYVFYKKILKVYKPNSKLVIELRDDPELSKAMDLLCLVYCSWLRNQNTEWPMDLPRPVEEPEHASYEHVANELCLCAIGYIFHHELAHLRLKHTGSSDVDKEKDADIAATDWILNNNINQQDYGFIKRALGIGIAFEVMVAYGIYTKDFGGRTHPYSYDRLYNNLDRYIQDPTHVSWAVIACTLKLHLDNANIPTQIDKFDDFKECVTRYIDVLSTIKS